MQLSWDFDQENEQPVVPRKRNASSFSGLGLVEKADLDTFYQTLKPFAQRSKSTLSQQQKTALKRQYTKLKRKKDELSPNPWMRKPRISQQDANKQWLEASQHFNKANRHKKIPSSQDDDAVKKATKKVIEWNLYNIYLRRKEERERIQTRLEEIMVKLSN
jgi:hypothetical protein